MELDEETAVMASGTMWQNISNLVVKFASFIYTILIARLVAQEEVGLFYFGLSIIGIMGIFADFGLATAVQRYVPYHLGRKEKAIANQIIRFAVVFGTAALVVGSLLTYYLAYDFALFFHNPSLEPVLRLLSVQLSIYAAFNILTSLLIAFKQMKCVSFGYGMQNILKIATLLALIFTLGADARTLSIAHMLSFIIPCFYLMWELRKPLASVDVAQRFSLASYWPIAKEIIPFGLTIVGIVLFSNLIAYTDRVMLGYFLQSDVNAQIAIYTIATSFAGLVVIFAGSVLPIFLPVVSELIGKGDKAQVNKISQTALRWVMFSSIPIAAFICSFSALILRVLYGAAYEAGAWALAFFALGTLFSVMGSVQRTALAGMRLVRIEMISMVCGALTNVALNLILIPAYGINGAAFSSMLAFGVMTLVNHHYACKHLGFIFPSSIWRNLLAGAMVLALLAGIQTLVYDSLINLPLQISDGSLAMGVMDKVVKTAILCIFLALGGLLYLVLVNLLHLFEHEDRVVFSRILGKFGVPKEWQNRIARAVFWDASHHEN